MCPEERLLLMELKIIIENISDLIVGTILHITIYLLILWNHIYIMLCT